MALKDIIVADLKLVSSDMGSQIFSWKGEEYECIPSTTSDQLTLEVGGFSDGANISFTVLKELFTDGIYPISQQKITYKNVTYRIQSVRQEVTDAFIRLSCVGENKGI